MCSKTLIQNFDVLLYRHLVIRRKKSCHPCTLRPRLCYTLESPCHTTQHVAVFLCVQYCLRVLAQADHSKIRRIRQFGAVHNLNRRLFGINGVCQFSDWTVNHRRVHFQHVASPPLTQRQLKLSGQKPRAVAGQDCPWYVERPKIKQVPTGGGVANPDVRHCPPVVSSDREYHVSAVADDLFSIFLNRRTKYYLLSCISTTCHFLSCVVFGWVAGIQSDIDVRRKRHRLPTKDTVKQCRRKII